MQENPTYTDVVAEVVAFLRDRAALAVSAGIERGRILIDPGIGFGKTVDHNLQLLRGLPELAGIGPPVLVGISRKAFIGKVLDLPDPRDRLAGSLACAVAAVLSGARVVRAHDVRETVEAVRVGTCLLRP
jgi:dihydropteroate synthase